MYDGPWIDGKPDGRNEGSYPELMTEIRRLFPDLPRERHLLIASLVTDTCQGCFAADKGQCYCMRDD